ncbi:hypothetical protein ACFE04_028666 [Oxalis oulophora]
MMMSSKVNSSSLVLPWDKPAYSTKKSRINTVVSFTHGSSRQKPIYATAAIETQLPKSDDVYTVSFKTLEACKLGIASYPDFQYNANGGTGNGTGKIIGDRGSDDEILVSFDLDTLYIPALESRTTKFLGLPLPPFLRIDIVPENFQGKIGRDSGKVDLEFTAKFCFSVGSIYRASPLLVKTVLTTDESKGTMKSRKGKRMDKEGKCRLVGVATVDPINDFLMNAFLGLPAECLADLYAVISISDT